MRPSAPRAASPPARAARSRSAPDTIDLGIDLQAFPLLLIDRAAGNQGLQGSVTGQARVGGTLANPTATFELRGTGLGARILRENGIPPLGLAAAGDYRGNTLTLRSATLTGPLGLDLRASGRIPLAGPGLDLGLSGVVPLALADAVLEERSTQAAGQLRVNATLRGSLAAPRYGGSVSLAGGTFVDPEVNLRLQNVALDASLEGTTATLQQLPRRGRRGRLDHRAGTGDARGRARLPGEHDSSRINDVRYTDGSFVSTRLSGALAVEGPLLRGGLLSGRIDLGADRDLDRRGPRLQRRAPRSSR